MSTIEITATASEELTIEESRDAMSRLILDRLGISREEFLKQLDAGAYAGRDDKEILHLVTLAPFAR